MADMSLESIVGNIAYSKSSVMAYYQLPPTRFDFASTSALIAAASQLGGLLSSLSSGVGKDVEYHMIVLSVPLLVDEWEQSMKATYQTGHDFIHEQASILKEGKFTEKAAFIGVKLGERSYAQPKNESLNPVKGAWNTAISYIDHLVGTRDGQVSQSEQTYWAKQEKKVRIIMQSSSLAAPPAEPFQIALMVRRMINPLNTDLIETGRQSWGYGAILSLLSCYVEKFVGYTKITYENDTTQYVTALTFSRFPSEMAFPEGVPWILAAQTLEDGCWFSARGTLIPPSTVQKQLTRNIQTVADEKENAAVAGIYNNLDIDSRMSLAEQLQYEMKNSQTPWNYANYRILVAGTTQKELQEKVSTLRQAYHQRGIELSHPLGSDQYNLLLECLPGDHLRIKDYTVRQNLTYLSGGLPNGASNVGDDVDFLGGKRLGFRGPIVGLTISALNQVVFFDPASAIARNHQPGVSVVGASGSGKSFYNMNKIVQDTILGKAVPVIDPKNDMKDLGRIPEIRDKTTTYQLASAPSGIVDPFSIYPNNKERARGAAESAIATMLGDSYENHYRVSFSTLFNEYCETNTNLSLAGFVEYLGRVAHPGRIEYDLLQELTGLMNTEFANLLFFSPSRMSKTSLDKIGQPGLIIVSLMGISLPRPSQKATNKELIGLAVLNMLLDKITASMLDKPKTLPMSLYIDEFRSIASTSVGVSKVEYLLTQGRSHNISTTIIDQTPSMVSKLSQHISTRIFFKVEAGAKSEKGEDEIKLAAEMLGVDDQSAFSILPKLTTGQAIMRDAEGRVAAVQLEPSKSEWVPYFETNPALKKEIPG